MKAHNYYTFICSIILLLSFIACKDKNKQSIIVDNLKVITQEKKETKSTNSIIVSELLTLKFSIQSSNKEKISNFFDFPSKRILFIPNRLDINKKILSNDSLITKSFFLKNSYVPKANYNPSLNNLLNEIDINLLESTNSVKKILEVKNDECSYFYKIEVSGKSVRLIYKSIANPKYEDNEYSCEPESDTIYMKMDGNRLLFDQDKIEMSYEPDAG